MSYIFELDPDNPLRLLTPDAPERDTRDAH